MESQATHKTGINLLQLYNSKPWIAFELIIVSVIIGFRLVPVTDTPVIFLIGWMALRFRNLRWRDIGFQTPENWAKAIGTGTILACLYSPFEMFVLEPAIVSLTGKPLDLSQFAGVQGNFVNYLILLFIGWTLAAIIEEMVYRGYLMNRFSDLFGKTNLGWGLAVLITAFLFGMAHLYQGISGVILITFYGIFSGALYLFSKRNLWPVMIFHGVFDTIGITLLYLGIYPEV